jgi:hypothetical protein
MPPQHYIARVTRLVGPGRTTCFEIELEPPGRAPGQVAVERVRVVIQGNANALPEWIMAEARQVLSSVAAVEWDWD